MVVNGDPKACRDLHWREEQVLEYSAQHESDLNCWVGDPLLPLQKTIWWDTMLLLKTGFSHILMTVLYGSSKEDLKNPFLCVLNKINLNILPRGSYHRGIEPSITWHGHSDGHDPANRTKHLIPKGLKMETETHDLIHTDHSWSHTFYINLKIKILTTATASLLIKEGMSRTT